MNILEIICPTFLMHYIRVLSVYVSKKMKKKRKSYDGLNEFEQEQFSIHSLSKDQQTISSSSQNTDPFHVKSQPFQQAEWKEQIEAKGEQNLQVFEQLNKLPIKINLKPYDRYYSLLEKKSKNINDNFTNESLTEIPMEEFKDTYSKFRIWEMPTSHGFQFVYQWTLPCSYSYYRQLCENTKLNNELATHIESYTRHESVYHNLWVMGLQLKKIMGLGLQPRSFTYIKYANSPEQNYNIQLCASIHNDYSQLPEIQIKSIKEGELLSLTKIKQVEGSTIYGRVYLHVDFKSIIKAHKIVKKGIKQLASYYQSIHQYTREHFNRDNIA